jgi:hypothetical protein
MSSTGRRRDVGRRPRPAWRIGRRTGRGAPRPGDGPARRLPSGPSSRSPAIVPQKCWTLGQVPGEIGQRPVGTARHREIQVAVADTLGEAGGLAPDHVDDSRSRPAAYANPNAGPTERIVRTPWFSCAITTRWWGKEPRVETRGSLSVGWAERELRSPLPPPPPWSWPPPHGTVFLLLGNERLGREQQCCDRRGVLQRRTGDLGRVDDTGFIRSS